MVVLAPGMVVPGMDQHLLANVRAFLQREKRCSNVEVEVPIPSRNRADVTYGRWDIVGGRLYDKGDRYIGLELHCIEHKSSADDVVRGIGQLFWYKFGMSQANIWVDDLFIYLLVDAGAVSDLLKDFCRAFGLGLLRISDEQKLVTEVVTPKNQHGFIKRLAFESMVARQCPKCQNSVSVRLAVCPSCGESSIELDPPYFFSMGDTFRVASRNPVFSGPPHRMPQAIAECPLLSKVFENWERVRGAWETSGGQ